VTTVSIVVPVLNEEAELEETLGRTRDPRVCERIVVDGGSTDGTRALATSRVERVLDSPRGRARQMNAGAAVATGDVLLFLHGDTWLPEGFGEAIAAALRDGAVGGRFDVALRGRHPFLPVVARLINVRSRLSGISTGDQAMFVRRDVFAEMGGFPEIPLMEDVAFSRALKRRGRVAALRERVATSGRRWEERGVARTIVLMWRLRLAYALGASPELLAQRYKA
jgi:rSAM/selenodomain-associated transferase 2